MLLLRRKLQESFCIGDDIEIVLIKVFDGEVTLGIKAPRGTRVDRSEVRKMRQEPGDKTDPEARQGQSEESAA